MRHVFPQFQCFAHEPPTPSIAATRPQANAGQALQRARVVGAFAPRASVRMQFSGVCAARRPATIMAQKMVPARFLRPAGSPLLFVSEEGAAFACWICAGRRTSAALGPGRSTSLVGIFARWRDGAAQVPAMLQTKEWAFANWLTIRQPEGLEEDLGPRGHAHREREKVPERGPWNPGSCPSQAWTHVDTIVEKRSSTQRRGPAHATLRDECAATGPLSLSPSTSCLQQDLRFGDFLLSAGLVREQHHPDGFLHLPPTSFSAHKSHANRKSNVRPQHALGLLWLAESVRELHAVPRPFIET
ncbi:hypothetical protein S40285_09954 [Stachybotrys chlorohalonatus IBT 40285]|uniref:Uncharacterized protein n=1 Tax=Stachybotrys chlorohalonatus (strain IBT 40285) TaxID=1283841 RepID=A0A084R1G2_STAC4|nr:hypothetical protein S40285_09954 [Stachybotrys chlorohalonata IBT 40285]